MSRRSRRKAKFYRPEVLLQQLEERIVLDAAVNPAVKDNPDNAAAGQPDGGPAATTGAPTAPAGTADLVPQIPDNLDHVFQGDLNVVLVAKDLADAQTFANAAPKDAKVIMFDAQHDNLASINTMLHEVVATTGHQIDNLLIIGHSTEGLLTIGTDQIQFFSLNDYRPTFEAIGQNLTADAQIQFYGCSVAGNVFGQALVDRIATYTTADVFASIDTTGGTRHDFSLEYSSNSAVHMDTVLATDALQSVQSELVTTVVSVPTTPWAEIQSGSPGGWASQVDNPLFTNVNGNLFFRAGNSGLTTTSNAELWFSDGVDNTPAHTYQVMDINATSSTASSLPMDLISFQGKLFFTADNGANGRELWVSDGLPGPDHTYKFAEINSTGGATGNAFSGTTGNNFTVFNGKLYFTASDSGTGTTFSNTELWVTDGVDGTPAHTHVVKDLTSGGSSSISNLTVMGDNLYFIGVGSTPATKYLWKYDAVNDPVQVSTVANSLSSMVNFNGTLFFSATGNGLGQELWMSDGTSWGTTMFADIYTGGTNSSSPASLTVVNDYLFFTANKIPGGLQLFGTDGVSAPTAINVPGGTNYSGIKFLTESGGKLFFGEATTLPGGTQGTNTPELWMYDPTNGLAGAAVNITGYPTGPYGLQGVMNVGLWSVADANGTPFFAFSSSTYGWEIFDYNVATDTITAHEAVAGSGGNINANFPVFVNGSVFWTATTTAAGRELYKFTMSPWETAGQGPTNLLGSLGGAYTEDDPTLLTFGGASPAFQVSDGTGDNLNVKLVASAGFSGISVDGSHYDKVVNLSGTAASINAQLLNLSGYLKPNFSGTAEIDITSTDPSGWSDTDKLFATVNAVADVPAITLPTGTVTKTENDNITTPLALASTTSLFNMFDADPGDNLILTAYISNPGDGTPGGYSGVNLTGSTGLAATSSIQGTWDSINAQIANKIYVTKNQDFNGAAKLWFTLSDGVNQTTAVYDKVTFTPINDGPANNIAQASVTTNEDTPVTFSTANGNRVFISDVDIAAGGTELFTVTLTTAKAGVGNTGTIHVIEDVAHPLEFLTPNDTDVVTLRGSIDNINFALDGMQFIPYAQNYAYTGTSGEAVLNILTSDNGNIGTGGTFTDSDTINFSVTPVADAPVNTLGTFNAAAGTTLVNLANGINVHDGDVNDIMFVEVSAGNGVTGLGWGWRTKYSPEYVFVGMEGFLNLPQVLSGLKAAIQPGFAGQATVHVTTGDIGGLTDTDTLSIWIDAPPGAPLITGGLTGYDVYEDSGTVNLGSCVHVTDPNNDFLTVTLTAPTTSGWSGLDATAASGATVSGHGTTQLTITGLVVPIQDTLATLTGTLKPDFNGDAVIEVTAYDGTTTMNSSVSVPIVPTNDAPVANVVAAVGNEDSAIGVTFGLTDPVDAAYAGGPNSLLSVNMVPGAGPLHGTLTPTANPANWIYTPDPDWFGPDTFTYTVTDNGGTGGGGVDTSAQVTGSITVNSVADAPVANASIAASGNEDSPITITGLGMAGDPHDAAGPGGANTLVSVGIATGPAHGTVAPGTGGNWVYTPNPDWFGTDAFTYTVIDNGDPANGGVTTSAPETVTVDVGSVNDAPVAVPLSVNVNPNSSVPITLAMTDPQDAAGPGGPNALAAVIMTLPSHGTLTPTPGDPAHWTYTPEAGYVGPDSFTYSVQDNGGTANGGVDTSVASATVSINVAPSNLAPVVNPAGNPVLTAINEDPTTNPGTTVATIIASAGSNISDADGNPLGLAITGADTANGTWQYSTNNGATWNPLGAVSETNATLLNGSALVKFVPNANWNGLAAVTFHAWDQTSGTNGQQNVNIGPGGGYSAFSVAVDSAPITVNAVDDAPVNTVPTAVQQTNASGVVTFDSAHSNLISISDIDAGSGQLKVTLTATHGTMTLHGVAGLNFSAAQGGVGDGTADATMTFFGTEAAINTALNGMTFTKATGYTGLATVTMTVNDQGNTGTGGPLSATSVANLSVEPYNVWFSGFGTEAGWRVWNDVQGSVYTHNYTVMWYYSNANGTWWYTPNGSTWVATTGLGIVP